MFVPITEYPSIVKDTEAYLRPVFASKNRLDNCMRYVTGLIVLPTRKNVLSISRSFVDCKDQSAVNNFITDSGWDEKAFHDAGIKMVRDEVEKRRILYGVLLIDDTINEKDGKHIEGVGTYWDHSQNKYVQGHNVITTYYVTPEFSVALDFAIYRKKEDCAPGEFRTKVEIARELISKAVGYGLPITRVVFDSWYATRDLIEHIEASGIKEWVTQAKSDRVVLSDDNRTETNLADYPGTIPEEGFRPVEIYTSSFGKKTTYWAYCTTVRMKFLGGRKVRLVISYDNQQLEGEPLFFMSNVRFWEEKKILQAYATRWSIEGFHRDAKQSLGLGEYQVRKIQGVRRHIAMVSFAYNLLQLDSGFGSIMGNLKANLRTIGSRCRLAGVQVLHSLISFVMKMAQQRKDIGSEAILAMLTGPLSKSKGYWG
jgi:SRSO17 transposase